MSSSKVARRSLASHVDRAIDGVLAVAARPGAESDAKDRLRGFERVLLLHLCVRLATGSFPSAGVSPSLQAALAGLMAGCLALSFVTRLAPLAVAGALCVMLALLSATFPVTGNHDFLELWALLLLLIVGRRTQEESELLLAAARWSIVIMFFYTGLQKVLYGSYFDAQYLTFEIVLKPGFAAVFAPLLPAEELARIQQLEPWRVGAGPFRSDAPLLLLASNAVYLFELAAPALLLWRRTRRAAVIGVILFTLAIQSGAREMYFGGLLANWILLFWPRNLHDRAFAPFAVFYGGLGLVHYLAPGAVI